MTDLAKARELAQKLGYISPGLDVICSANTSPERLGELRAMGFNPIFDDAKHAVDFGVKLAESDPSGFRSWLTDWLQHTPVYAQASSTSLGRPPTMIEPAPQTYFPTGTAITLDRYARNPAVDFFTQVMPGADLGPAPTMFALGDLPVITGSGLDPQVLLFVPWFLRHSAAIATNRSTVMVMIEEGATGDPDLDRLQNDGGREQLQAYFLRADEWVRAKPVEVVLDSDIDQFIESAYGPDAG
jgi:hypothetical protein